MTDDAFRIKDLKEFEKLLKMCQRSGVTSITLPGLVMKLGELPAKAPADAAGQSDAIPTDEPSPEELMFYHVQDPG